jgi:hypothetical protein
MLMNSRQKLIAIIVMVSSFSLAWESQAQDKALQQLINGKKFFWEARFDDARKALEGVLAIETAKNEYRRDAQIFLGFVLMRQAAGKSIYDKHFEAAIRIDQEYVLDPRRYPPDLLDAFNGVKSRLIGCLYVEVTPEDGEIVGVKGDSILFRQPGPLDFCGLANGDEYELLITRDGYSQELVTLHLKPGITDTLRVTMTLLHSREKGGIAWPWVFRSTIVAGAAAIVYTTILAKDDSGVGPEPPGGTLLPEPPARPAGR